MVPTDFREARQQACDALHYLFADGRGDDKHVATRYVRVSSRNGSRRGRNQGSLATTARELSYAPSQAQRYCPSCKRWSNAAALSPDSALELSSSDESNESPGKDVFGEHDFAVVIIKPKTSVRARAGAEGLPKILLPPPSPRNRQNTTTTTRDLPRGALRALSKRIMHRGGAYGLTGNAIVVTRARELLNTGADDGESLLEAAQEWERAVERRRLLGLPAVSEPLVPCECNS